MFGLFKPKATWEQFYEAIPFSPEYKYANDVLEDLRQEGYRTTNMELFMYRNLDTWEKQGLILKKEVFRPNIELPRLKYARIATRLPEDLEVLEPSFLERLLLGKA